MFESLKLFIRQNAAQLAIVGVMVTVSVVSALAVGGDVGEALARRGR